MSAITAFLAGLVFGVGLLISGMTDPGKVIGFLDVAGTWDPSLAFVMAGAILVAFFAFAFARQRARTFLGAAFELPERRDIDVRLVAGSIVFGIGWGLAGFCPGPAIVAFGAGFDKATVFVIAMIAGMILYRFAETVAREQPASAGSGPSRR